MRLTEFYIKKAKETVGALAYQFDQPFEKQQKAIREKLIELLRMPEQQTTPVPLIEWEDQSDPRFDEIRFRVETEPGFYVPAHLLLPKEKKEKWPVMICLQGHSPGMHCSMGRVAIGSKEPVKEVNGERDFALQAVAHGYAALAMEQRGLPGELEGDMRKEHQCTMAAAQSLALGRTLLGERIFDVSRMIDAIEQFEFLDCSRIGAMGNSGGGTAAFYAACVDERIKALMPSCFYGEFVHSFFGYPHCSCGFIPDFCKWFDLPDLTALIAPRPLVLVAGENDPLSDIKVVRSSYAQKVEPIYAAAGKPENCRLAVGPEGHRFYAGIAWEAYESLYPI